MAISTIVPDLIGALFGEGVTLFGEKGVSDGLPVDAQYLTDLLCVGVTNINDQGEPESAQSEQSWLYAGGMADERGSIACSIIAVGDTTELADVRDRAFANLDKFCQALNTSTRFELDNLIELRAPASLSYVQDQDAEGSIVRIEFQVTFHSQQI
jgi:hypothetical protein